MTGQRWPRRLILGGSLLLFVALLGPSVLFLLSSPRFGATAEWDEMAKRWKVVSASPDGPIKPGDIILRVGAVEVGFLELLGDNIYIGSRQELFAWFEARGRVFAELQRAQVPFLVERAGRPLELAIRPHRAGWSCLSRIELLHMLVGIAFFGVGIIVLHRRARLDQQGLVFFLLCLSMMLVYITNATSLLSVHALEPPFFALINVVNVTNFFLAPALLLHFSLLLPKKRQLLVRFPWVLIPYYAYCAAVVLLLHIGSINVAVPLFFFLSLVSIVSGFIVFRRQPLERQQMKWVAAGFAFGVSPWIIINGLPLLITGERLMNDTIPGAFLVCIPVGMALAIQRSRLLDIDALFRGTFVWVLTILLLSIVDIAFLALLSSRFGQSLDIDPTGKVLLNLILIVSLYAPVRAQLLSILRRLYGRRLPDEAEVMAGLIDRASGQPPDAVLEVFRQTLEATFKPAHATLVGREDPSSRGVIEALGGHDDPVWIFDEAERGALPRPDTSVLVPLMWQREVRAVVMLGELSQRRLYTRQALGLMAAVARQASLLYENASLFESNLRQSRERVARERRELAEREEMVRELHDGLGGVTTRIVVLADAAEQQVGPRSETGSAFTRIAGLGRECLEEIRGFMRSLDAQELDWETLTAEMRLASATAMESLGISLEFAVTCSKGAPPPRAPQCFHINRILREALTNIIKHAQARTVQIDLAIGEEGLRLLVADDGVGLPGKQPPSPGPGRGLRHMERRARSCGGVFSLTSQKDKGTRVIVEIPLEPPVPAGSAPGG